MHPSKHIALAFLFGAVLVGGALGFTADRVLTRGDRGGRTLDMLDERLSLSDQQRAKFDSILDARHRQFAVEYDRIKPRMDSIRLNAREQMRQVLTAEQRAEFEKLLAELSDSTKKRSR
jgi:Spy/CpxP family protein refolding chaperone